MKLYVSLVVLIGCSLTGCGTSYRAPNSHGPPLAVHLVTDKGAPDPWSSLPMAPPPDRHTTSSNPN